MPRWINDDGDRIQQAIQGAGDTIKQKYIDKQVQQEISKRADLLASLVALMSNVRNSISKIKPDILSYNEDGSGAGAFYSKGVLDSKAKLTEKLAKADAVLKSALVNNDYAAVEEMIANLK